MTTNKLATHLHEHGINTSTLADVLDGMGRYGTLTSRLKRHSGHTELFAGRAYTVNWGPARKTNQITAPQRSTWSQVRDFLVPELSQGNGLVYVGGGGPLITEAALAGGLSATYFEQIGFEGIVLGGAIRDAETLGHLKLPVVCSNFIPTDTQGSFVVTSAGTRCVIDNLTIDTGDWVVSDRNGTVVVPDALLAEVIDAATAIARTEDAVISRIRSGERLPNIIEEVGRI